MIDYDKTAQPISVVHLGADHAGFELKEVIKEYLEKMHYQVMDHGAFEYDEDDDYPDFCGLVGQAVSVDAEARGIVIGGSGQGEAMSANRYANVRAMVFNGQYEPFDGREVPNEIVTSRQHNDSNVLSLGARFLSEEEAIEATQLWLETAFSGEERHERRIEKIENC